MKNVLLAAAAAFVSMSFAAVADDAPLFNVAQYALGANATGSGSPFNKDWHPNGVLHPPGRGGTLWGTPDGILGGRVDIYPIMPVDIEAIALSQLDWGDVRVPKTVNIYINGAKVMTQELPLQPGKFFQFPCVAKKVTSVGIECIDQHPRKVKADGSLGAPWGGWSRIQILSKTDLSLLMAPPSTYAPAVNPAAIAASQKEIAGEVKVYGEPRQAAGNPRTIWDKQDIEELKALIGKSMTFTTQFNSLKAAMDARVQQPAWAPPALKDANGNYRHVSSGEQIAGEASSRGGLHNNLAVDIANLGAMYALTDDPKYGEYCKQLLLAYAREFPNYVPGNRPGFTHDVGKTCDQRLGDSIWVIQVARGYDLIYNLPSITAEERALIENDLLIACADFIAANSAHLRSPTNWSAIGTAAVMICGYATNNERLINLARWGFNGSKENPAVNRDGIPTSGAAVHFGPQAIDVDGMWSEGAMGYQFMALQGVITMAEILWRNGEDMYRYRDGAVKSLFDSPLEFSYPNLFSPATQDSGNASIVGRDSYLYEHAYLRYRDPKFRVILNRVTPRLAAAYQQWPTSMMYDRDEMGPAPEVEWNSVNLNGVGFGILRNTDARGTRNLLLNYSPNRSHVHPDKLGIDLWLYGENLAPDPGMVWYEHPLYKGWYWQTIAHNTLVVDEKSQLYTNGDLIVFAPAMTFGMQRATCDKAHPGVTMDRSLFITADYMADIFGAFAQLPRTMDLPWHIRGDFAQTGLKLKDFAFAEPVQNGYQTFENVQKGDGSKPWNATFTLKDKTYRFFAAGAPGTDVIIADGLWHGEKPKTIIERRKTNQTLYGNVLDYSLADKPFVKKVEVAGSLEKGFGVMTITTVAGKDLASVSYRPGTNKDLTALQTFVRLNTKGEVYAAYLGGGTKLANSGFVMERDNVGLLSFELLPNGSYVFANPSSEATTAQLAFAKLNGLEAYKIDAMGKRLGAQTFQSVKNTLTIPMAAGDRFEFAPKGSVSMYDARQKLLAEAAAIAAAAAKKIVDEINARDAARIAAAAENPLPADTVVVVPAPAYTDEGGGKVTVVNDRVATAGPVFMGWNNQGHWLEWKVEAPAAGWYNFAMCYAQEPGKTTRRLFVNGVDPEPNAPLELKGTGGWARSSDDWRIHVALNPVTEKPLLIYFEAGENTIRINNDSGEGCNMNYIAIFSPDVTPTRDLLGAKIK